MGAHLPELEEAAKKLYLRRHKPKEIHEVLNIPLRTVYDWCKKGNWNDLLLHEAPADSMARRLSILVDKSEKEKKDLDEIKILTDSIVKLKSINPNKGGILESGGTGNKQRKKRNNTKKFKNDVTGIKVADFKAKLHKAYFKYQLELREQRHQRTRMLLKSRQIGATWYFAQEAFEDAALRGRNKIFLSATRAQAEVFRRYIIAIAQQHFDIDLKGNPIVLHTNNGPTELHFLSNNSSSAQSYTGDVYIDEFFWIQSFNDLYKVATGMSSQKHWRRTLFSTPSAVTHQAYDLWTGDRFNSRFKKKRIEFPGFKEMQSGILCPDKAFRKIITLDDAERGGCNLFDKEELKLEYSPAEFKNLFGCQFVDDTFGVFKFADLESCGVDPEDWKEIDRLAKRPVGMRPVYGGYDPSRSADDASFVVVLPPLKAGEKFKVILRLKWVNKSFKYQAEQIKELCKQFNFTYMGIDVTGMGYGVYETVKGFYPRVTPIHYSVGSKTHMVLKAQEVISENRIEWDADETSIAHAFLTIRKVTTPGGAITYAASRTSTTGHADVAWAIMHTLIKEPISHEGVAKSSVSFSGL